PVLARAFKKAASERTASVGDLADEIGAAYGLSGDHLGWAATPEQELGRRVERELPRLSRLPAGRDDLAARGQPREPRGASAGPIRSRTDSEAPSGVPTSGFAWLPALVVGGMALVIGVLIVLAVMSP